VYDVVFQDRHLLDRVRWERDIYFVSDPFILIYIENTPQDIYEE
jgi:hypothetical protein